MTLQSELGLFVTAADSFVELTARSLTTVTEYVDRQVPAEELDSAVTYYLAAAEYAARADPDEVAERGRQAGAALGDDPAAGVRVLRDAAVQRLDGQPDVLMHTIVGGMWLRNYLPTRTFELAVHGLDIARAAGLPAAVPGDVLAAAVALASQVAVAAGQGAEMLLALTGRERLRDGFSVV